MSHPEALEALYWHDMNAISQPERSDESFKALRKFELVERRPATLNLTDTEVLEWLVEMEPDIDWQGVCITVPEIGRTFGKTLKEAVCLAAAKWKEMNE